jgi:hypothetical protein
MVSGRFVFSQRLGWQLLGKLLWFTKFSDNFDKPS